MLSKRIMSSRVLLFICVLLASMSLALLPTDNTPSASAASCPTLKRGSTGSAVRLLQTDLNLNYNNPYTINNYSSSSGILSVDGEFGPRTEVAVKAYQKENGLTVDGKVGPQTWGSLGGCTQPTVDGYLKQTSYSGYIIAETYRTEWRDGILLLGSGTRTSSGLFRFTITSCSNKTLTIKSLANGRYVSAELGYGTTDTRYGMLRARATSVGSWETFTFKDSGNPYSLRAQNGLYSKIWNYVADHVSQQGVSAKFPYEQRGRFDSPLGYNGYNPC